MDGPDVKDVLKNLREHGPKKAEDGVEKKKVNSRRKGIAFERRVCEILKARFGKPFGRSPGSGAFGTVAKVDSRALEVLNADIITPEGFLWSVEAKSGYDVDIISLFTSSGFKGRTSDEKTFQDFWAQAVSQAERVGKKPVVIYKKDNRPPVILIKRSDSSPCSPALLWEDRVIISLDSWLQMDDSAFFEED